LGTEKWVCIFARMQGNHLEQLKTFPRETHDLWPLYVYSFKN